MPEIAVIDIPEAQKIGSKMFPQYVSHSSGDSTSSVRSCEENLRRRWILEEKMNEGQMIGKHKPLKNFRPV